MVLQELALFRAQEHQLNRVNRTPVELAGCNSTRFGLSHDVGAILVIALPGVELKFNNPKSQIRFQVRAGVR